MQGERQNWHCLQLAVPQAQSEEVAAHCFELGSCGLQSEEEGEIARLTVYFAAECDLRYICGELAEQFRTLGLVEVDLEIQSIKEQDWEVEWRRFFKPVWATPHIVVHPSWIPVQTTAAQIALVIDPKMAFGTGGHESTQLCLAALEKEGCSFRHCLDLGTGSAILAIAAAKLGARHVLGLDIDPQAVENARENIERNGLEATQVEVRQGGVGEAAGQRFDLVLANIQSHVLRPLLAQIRDLLEASGRVVFSGLLGREEEAFCQWAEEAGLTTVEVLSRGEWIAVVAARSV